MPASYLLPDQPCRTVGEYRAAGQGDAVAAARALGAASLVELLESSGLRARDHGAVSVGAKWAVLTGAGPDAGPRYLVANGTDAEPGSFTDRALLRSNPLGVIEGVAVAAIAIGARDAFIAIRHSFETEYEILTTALAEAEVAGWLDRVSIKCVRTPEEYLVGDERALLECIEGRAPLPVRRAPGVDGLFVGDGDRTDHAAPTRSSVTGRLSAPYNPTAVESLATLVNVAAIAVSVRRIPFMSLRTAAPFNVEHFFLSPAESPHPPPSPTLLQHRWRHNPIHRRCSSSPQTHPPPQTNKPPPSPAPLPPTSSEPTAASESKQRKRHPYSPRNCTCSCLSHSDAPR